MLEHSSSLVQHGDEGLVFVFADLIDGADVAMIERGGGAGLTVKRCSACWSEANPSERNSKAMRRWSVVTSAL
jgi:hypothetical protein